MDHSFDIEIAQKYGMAAAVLYRNFQFWIAKNKANGKNFRDGRTWTYNSARALWDLHPYLTVWDTRKALKILLDAGILLAANYNAQGYDRTTWYAFEDEKTALKGLPAHLWNSQMDGAKSANGFVPHTDQYQIQKPDALPDKNKTKEVEISPQKRLDLDLLITQGKNFLIEQLVIVLHPNSREAKTFARIVKYLIEECQACRLPVSIFKDAVEWARQARASSATNPKGLFVAKIKEETGFRAQKQILKKV
jgi:hypothetical protein